MRDLARINRIQGLIHNIWLQHPDMGYGRLIGKLFYYYLVHIAIRWNQGVDFFDMEDSDWEEFLINFRGFE